MGCREVVCPEIHDSNPTLLTANPALWPERAGSVRPGVWSLQRGHDVVYEPALSQARASTREPCEVWRTRTGP